MADTYLPSTGYSNAGVQPVRNSDAGGSREPCELVIPRRSKEPTQKSRRNREIPCEILASLFKGNRKMADLCEMVGTEDKVIRGWIEAFHASGLVYVVALQGSAMVYGIQPQPFQNADAVPLHRWSRKR